MPEALAAALVAADALARDLPITERTGRLSVRAAAQGPAEIGIYGEIGWEVTARDVRDALKPLAGRDLLIRVNSPGGSAFDGFAIYNMLARHEGRKTVQIEALAASAASYIAMAGDDIEMPAASFLMIHNSGVLAMGDRNTLAETISILERLDAAMRDIYAARTGLSADAIAAMMDAETWMTAEEAVEHGFATAILPPASAPQAHALTARAKAVLSGFRAAPAAAVALSTLSTPPAIPPARPQEAPVPEANVTPATTAAPPVVVQDPPKASLADLQGIVARSNGRLSSDFIVAQLAAGATMDTARDAAIEAVASAPRPATHITITSDERETVRAGMQAALAFRAGDRKVDLRAGPGRPYAHMSLREMARAAVQSVGGKPDGLSPLEIAGAALGLPGFMAAAGMHTTSDFPLILGNTARKVLLDAYVGASSEWRTIARPTSHSDFKATSYLRLSEGPALLEVPEHAEFKHGTMSEKGESLNLKTWGRIIAITRQAIINDDLSAFTRLPTLYGRSAADLVSNLVWAVLTANPTMGDGVALFHASHGNLAASGAAITEASLAAAITAMRKQKGMTDNPIVITPKYLIVSPDKEFEAKKLLATTFNLPDGTANIVGQGLTLVVTPWLTGNAWYLSVDPSAFETIFVPFLNGNEEPRIEERVGFEVDGLEIKAALDVNAAPIDWRGLYKNPGA